MRVGLDARALAAPFRSGVEQYVVNLVCALSRLQEAPEIIAYVDRPIPDPELARVAASGPLRTSVIRARRGWLRAALPWRLWRDGVDLVHLPSTILPPLLPCPAVVTVHDLAWRKFPEAYRADDLAMQEVALASAARAARVLAVSNATARDLAAAGIPSGKISVALLGVPPRFSPDGPGLAPGAFPGAEALRQGYLLYVGRLQARKNLLRVMEAYRRVRETLAAPPLVLVGGSSDYGEEVARRAQESGIAEHLLLPGHLADDILPSLYRGATLFVYPSLYEGFGMPVLEAMASGTPVITSDRSGTAEVAGDAALLVDSESVEQITSALLRLLQDEGLRKDLAERGLARSRGFRWERTATETVAVYRRIAGGG